MAAIHTTDMVNVNANVFCQHPGRRQSGTVKNNKMETGNMITQNMRLPMPLGKENGETYSSSPSSSNLSSCTVFKDINCFYILYLYINSLM